MTTTTTSKAEVLTLNVTRTIKAPVELVYKGWTEPEQMRMWLGCLKTSSVKVTQDLRVGGEYRFDVSCNDGEEFACPASIKKLSRTKARLHLE